MAFRTAHHKTTYLILEQLVEKIYNGTTVLDLGTGSGVLAIAAKILGANSVTAVEFDKDCKYNFNENLELNDLSGEIPLFFEDV